MSSTIWGDDVLISWGSGFWQPPTASLVKLLIGWSVERRRRGQLEYPAGVQTLSKFNKSPGHPLRASHLVSSFSFLFLFFFLWLLFFFSSSQWAASCCWIIQGSLADLLGLMDHRITLRHFNWPFTCSHYSDDQTRVIPYLTVRLTSMRIRFE